jgi:hypothetical protein
MASTNSIASKVLSLIGITGAGGTTNSIVPPDRRQAALQSEFDKAGEIANPDIWSAYSSATSRPRTLEEQLRNWDEMSHWDLMAAALAEIVEEATQVDPSSPGAIWYECTDKAIEDDLNEMLQEVDAEDFIRSQIWSIAAYGNNFEKLDYAPGEGVKGFTSAHPMDVRRYWLHRNRRCVGFRWKDQIPNKENIFSLPGIGKIARAGVTLDKTKSNQELEQLWYPWDMMHMRRIYKSRQTEHGEPLFEEAQGIYKKLRMALDQMVVHRAQIQPDRYVVNIDVKDQIPIDQIKTVQRWKQSLRSKLSFGSGIGGVTGQPDDFKSFYNAMALDTILWMAKPRDFQHGIEKLAGTASVPDVQDIELLTNLFFSIIGMPKSWIGLGGDSKEGPASGKALLAQDMRFLRKVKSLRAPVLAGYEWLAYFHCLLKGKDISSVDIKSMMPPIGSLEDTMKLELLQKQTEILDALAEIMPKYGLPREVWIDLVFKKYMRLPDEVVDAFLTALPDEVEPVQAESIRAMKAAIRGTGTTPYSKANIKQITEDVISKLGPDRDAVVRNIHDILDGKKPRAKKRFRTADNVLRQAVIKEGDLIVSGFGQLDPINEFKPVQLVEASGAPAKARNVFEMHLKSRG